MRRGIGTDRRRRIAVSAIALSLLAAVTGCDKLLGSGVATENLTSPCPTGSESSARTMGVQSTQVNIRTGPGTSFERVIDRPTSRTSGTTAYASLGAQFTVLEECRKGSWSRVWVTEPEHLRATHHGWVANRFLTEISASASKSRSARNGRG